MKDNNVKSVEQIDKEKQQIMSTLIKLMDKDGVVFSLHSEIFDIVYKQYTKPLNKMNFTVVFILCIFWIISITVDKAAPFFLTGVFSCLALMIINQLYLKIAYNRAKQESTRLVKNITTVLDTIYNMSNSNENKK